MKTLLVGQHFLIRDALRGILEELKENPVIIEAADGRQAMQVLAEQADVSLVMLDLDLPDRNGLSALRELRERHPAVPVIIISGIQDYNTIVTALHLGARGFILKSGERQIMLSALELVFAGGIYIPREILALESSSIPKIGPSSDAANRRLSKLADLGLTDRQLDVLKSMMQGKGNKAICRELNLAEPTVKNHVTAILRQLGVSSRVEAVLAVWALGWQQPPAEKTAGPANIVRLPTRLLGRA